MQISATEFIKDPALYLDKVDVENVVPSSKSAGEMISGCSISSAWKSLSPVSIASAPASIAACSIGRSSSSRMFGVREFILGV